MPRILVIDDDEDVRDAMKEAFEAEGFEVQTAENGRPGIQAIQANDVDAVVVDAVVLVVGATVVATTGFA